MATSQPPQQQFCVRWNSYQSNLQNAFPKLLTSEHFVDVTLACESEMIKCHKVVLSACSTYFEKLLVQNPCQHPIIFMKDMKFIEMQALVDFMYKGEVNVTQDELPSLLRSAEALQIRGLCGSDQLLNQHYLGTLQAKAASQTNGDKSPHQNVPQPPKTEEKLPKPDESEPLNTSETQLKKETNLSVVPQTETAINGTATEDELSTTLSTKEEFDGDDSYYDGEGELVMDQDYMDQDEEDMGTTIQPGTSGMHPGDPTKTPEFAIANVSCQYAGDSGGGISGNRRIRRSEAELRRAAECITRGQTFQNVSDQFNIPISTIRKMSKRDSNWTYIEKKLLIEEIGKFIHVIEDKSMDTRSLTNKNSAWKKIRDIFILNGFERDVDKLRGQWKRMKIAAKMNISKYKSQSKSTAGGPPPKIPDELDYAIDALIPKEFHADVNISPSEQSIAGTSGTNTGISDTKK